MLESKHDLWFDISKDQVSKTRGSARTSPDKQHAMGHELARPKPEMNTKPKPSTKRATKPKKKTPKKKS
jgi:hypothetical protein